MRIDRRLVLIGIMVVVLSMTMATQYATTKISYSYGVVNPSNADIRFVASDNSSADGLYVLRVANNATPYATVQLGDWFPNSDKTYTAAFGIVNEEQYPVNITYINVTSGTYSNYMSIWLHGDRDEDATSDGTAVKVVDGGTALFDENSVCWTLGAGDGDPDTMDGSNTQTPWDETSHIRYSHYDTDAVNGTSDFVWVQITLNIPSDAAPGSASGTIYIHFKAAT